MMMMFLLTAMVMGMMGLWWWRRRRSDEWAECGSEGCEWASAGGWVRPLSTLEHLCWVAGLVGTMNTAQVLYLHTSQPVSTRVVRRALTVLAQKCLVLQLCLEHRWCWPWYRRMDEVQVELTESTDEPLDVYERDLARGYNMSKGPLWRVTIVRPPHAKEEMVLVFTIQHSVTDGTTNMILSRDLLTIINNIMTEQDHNTTPIRGLVPPISISLSSPYDILPILSLLGTVIREGMPGFTRGGAQYLPPPPPAPPLTSAICHDFPEEVTSKLAKRCKEAGVRIHSCLLAACSLAFLRTMRKDGNRVANMPILHETAVNVRRYYPASQREAMGTVSFLALLKHQVDEAQDFWTLGRTIQGDLYRVLDEEKVPLRIARNGLPLGSVFLVNKLLSKLGLPAFTYTNFTCTNMGDLRNLLPTTYPGPVSVTKLLRSTQAELGGTCFCVVAQTLGGKLMVSVEHYTTRTTRDTVKTFLTHLAHILTHLALTGTTPYDTPHLDTLLDTTDTLPTITTTTHYTDDTPSSQPNTTISSEVINQTDSVSYDAKKSNPTHDITTPNDSKISHSHTNGTISTHTNDTTTPNDPKISHSHSNGTIPTHAHDPKMSHSHTNGTIPTHTNDTTTPNDPTLSHSHTNGTILTHTNDTTTPNDPTLSHSHTNGSIPLQATASHSY